jgi:hypothetical protein
MRGRLLAVGCLLLVVSAGCQAPTASPGRDPGADRLGWEGGYWADDAIEVTTSDGLNESELDAVTARQMARLEELRELEFQETVPVQIINRSTYRERRANNDDGDESGPTTHQLWNDQVWEALFIVGEDRHFHEVYGDTLGASVLGFYSPRNDTIVIVSDDAAPLIDRQTLTHELVHALQDQHFGLDETPATQDAQLARQGVVEGEANLLESAYESACNDRWTCIDRPARSSGGNQPTAAQRGVFLTILQPYATGPRFVDAVRSRQDWVGVSAMHEEYPASTEQIIHPEAYPDETPVDVSVADRSSDDWSRFDVEPTADTVGEASIYAMVVHNDVGQATNGRYGYDHPASAGWAGDSVVPYRNGDRYGYVWRTRWDSPGDAREFATAYRDLLAAHDAVEVRPEVYVIPEESGFADAFHVRRTNTTVTVVNAPTPAALLEVHDPSSATGEGVDGAVDAPATAVNEPADAPS